jgi:DNA-directed RNA polymerase specialized sigma subunit
MAATVAKRKHAFVAEFGREPTDAELSEILQLSAKRINGAHVADISIASLDDKVTEDDDTTFEDMLHEVIDDEDDTPADMPDAIRDVRALIKKLPDKDRFLLERTYGIGCDVVPIEVLMQETGMSMTCIRGRLHTLKRHLRSVLEDKRYSF